MEVSGESFGDRENALLIPPQGVQPRSPAPGELVKLCAKDGLLFGRIFFPKTCRQQAAPIHRRMWDEGFLSRQRFVQIVAARGLSKTSQVRLYTAFVISYALSNVALYVGPNEDHAKRSLRWLRRQLVVNHKWTSTYGLIKAGKWSDTWLEVENTVLGETITLLAVGWESSTRGINVDDYRPDLIILDDLLDPKTTCSSPGQVKKLNEDVNGGLRNSLAPEVDAPLAKLVAIHTPAVPGDLAEKFAKDPQFYTIRASILNEDGTSSWPDRYPTDQVLKDKESAIAQGEAHLWYREKEVTLIPAETCDFREEWLQEWEPEKLPEGGRVVMCIDPVPPPTDAQIKQGLRDKDKEAIVVGKKVKGVVYLLECRSNKGHYPDWTIANIWEMILHWQVQDIIILAVNYEHTLKWLVEQSMRKYHRWLPVHTNAEMVFGGKQDRRAKPVRITQAYRMVAPFGNLRIARSMSKIREQFALYPNVAHEDELEAGAGVITACMSEVYGSGDDWGGDGEELPPIPAGWKCQL